MAKTARAKTLDERGAEWITDEENNIFIYRAVKVIEKNEEILIYYGPKWWEHHNQKYLPENIK